MDQTQIRRKIRRRLAGEIQADIIGHRQDIDGAQLNNLIRSAYILGAEPAAGGICIYIMRPGGEVAALLIEGAADQAGDYAALRITKAEIK